jgi:hypothetical protein
MNGPTVSLGPHEILCFMHVHYYLLVAIFQKFMASQAYGGVFQQLALSKTQEFYGKPRFVLRMYEIEPKCIETIQWTNKVS